MAGETSLFVGLFLLLAGGYGLYFGFKRRGPYELITETPTTEIRQLEDPGLVELKGTARADEEHGTFTSPVGQRGCMFAAWSVEEYQSSGRSSSWSRIASGVRSVPFAVDDGTGSVTVSPGDHVDGGRLTGASDAAASDGVTAGPVLAEFDRFSPVVRTEAGEPPPTHVQRLINQERAVDEESSPLLDLGIGTTEGDRRYYERTIAPGDEVYVLGEAIARNPDAVGSFRTEDLVVRAPDAETMIVSNQREQELVSQFRWYKLGIAGGMAAVAAGLLVLSGFTPL